MARILVVEDEESISDYLRRALAFEGYEVAVALEGSDALRLALDNPPDLVVLDLMLPGMDGLEVCRRLRHGDETLPILILSARGSVHDRVIGLDTGADTYMVKPFSTDELLANVRALLRRRGPSEKEELRFADLRLNTKTREVWRANRPLILTSKQFDVLEYFMRRPRQVLSEGRILEEVWGSDWEGDSNIVNVYVSHLRKKLEEAGEPRLIWTVRGAGFVLREEQG
jgi:two-component system response regulator MprA